MDYVFEKIINWLDNLNEKIKVLTFKVDQKREEIESKNRHSK